MILNRERSSAMTVAVIRVIDTVPTPDLMRWAQYLL
jgi:hypothetical protein